MIVDVSQQPYEISAPIFYSGNHTLQCDAIQYSAAVFVLRFHFGQSQIPCWVKRLGRGRSMIAGSKGGLDILEREVFHEMTGSLKYDTTMNERSTAAARAC